MLCLCVCVCVCVCEEHLHSNPWMYPTQTASRGNIEDVVDLLRDEDSIGRDDADYFSTFQTTRKAYCSL